MSNLSFDFDKRREKKKECNCPAFFFFLSTRMTKYDVRNYLKSIYEVPVVAVRTRIQHGKNKKNHLNQRVKQPDYKVAYVQLARSASPLGHGIRHCSSMFKANDLQVTMTTSPRTPLPPDKLVFGKTFTDHMLSVSFSEERWGKPSISPLRNLSLHPAVPALNYSMQLFEGMKAFYGEDGNIRMFRPQLNMSRMRRTAMRACLPDFSEVELLECVRRLVELEKKWVPKSNISSLYIRPVYIGTETSLGVAPTSRALLYVILSPVGPYFPQGGFQPVSLLADPKFVRSWHGGVGDFKMGGNYNPTILVQNEAQRKGCQQVLWLHGPRQNLTEAGTMNIFIYWTNASGEEELVTPPLDGLILPGVIRQSLVELVKRQGKIKMSEREVSMEEFMAAMSEDRVKEMFGSGTACVVCPISKIVYNGKDLHIPTMKHGAPLASSFLKELNDIQYGRTQSDWTYVV
uniref:Branched-chain-amino-acid aminotransferase n=1 Tax=Eptatretus burgeri TaxID=7764 RepID=A0A8C4WZI9_EPTBU